MNSEELKYPIGRYSPPEITAQVLEAWIADLDSYPALVASRVERLLDEELNYTYRPEGWSIRQVVHHIADSHMNALCRFKLALTEDNPTIKPYEEAKWALLDDVVDTPVAVSISIIAGLHKRLVALLRGMSVTDYARTYVHPQHGRRFDLAYTVGMYRWHSYHHLAHIDLALKYSRRAWNLHI